LACHPRLIAHLLTHERIEAMTLEQIREGLVTLIDANDTVENNVVHASPEMRKAQRIGNALRNAVNALKDCDDWSSVPPPKSWPVVD
jgi:hypothetical protein